MADAFNKLETASLQAWPRKAWYSFCNACVQLTCWWRFELSVEGRELLPDEGSCILVANHSSYWDIPFVAHAVRWRRVSFMAKEELFRSWVGQWVYSPLCAFSVNREKLEVSTIRSAKNVLATGTWHLGMFPEGTRNQQGDGIQGIKKGVAFIAKSTGSPVIPIGIHRSGPNRKRVDLTIAPPLRLQAGESVDDFSDRIQKALEVAYERSQARGER